MEYPKPHKDLLLGGFLVIILFAGFVYLHAPVDTDELYSAVHGNRLLGAPERIGKDVFNFDQPFLGKLFMVLLAPPTAEQIRISLSLNEFDQGEVQGLEEDFESQIKKARRWNMVIWMLTVSLLYYFNRKKLPVVLITAAVLLEPRLTFFYLEPILTLFTVIALIVYFRVPKQQIGVTLVSGVILGLVKHWYWIFYQIYTFVKHQRPVWFVGSTLVIFVLLLFLNFFPLLTYLYLRAVPDVYTHSGALIDFLTRIRYIVPLIPYLGDFNAENQE